MKKIVNGDEIELTPEEEAAVQARWAENAANTQARLEAEVENIADEITANGDKDVAMALATVDLVIAARDGQLGGLTKAQVRQAYRDRVVRYLRQKRGLQV